MHSLNFRLFVAGKHHRSRTAIQSVQEACTRLLGTADALEVVDVLEQPDLAENHRILATPTLIRLAPLPSVRLIGDMSDKSSIEKLIDGHGSAQRPM